MTLTRKSNRSATGTASPRAGRRPGRWLIALLAILLAACSDEPQSAQPPPSGISFFELGADSVLTSAVRDRLSRQLGSEAITRRGTLDLETTRGLLLRTHFPELYRLNQALNYPPMERVEHDITRLTYRYASQQDLPFQFVELVFRNVDGHPLMFDISLKTDGPAIVEQLEQKYGPPQTIQEKGKPGRILHWQKDGDVLLVSIAPNRLGEDEYHIAMYFVKNLERMVQDEKQAAEKRQQALKRAGEKAF